MRDREVEELRKELKSKTAEAEEATKALEDRLTEDRVRNGDLNPDEVWARARRYKYGSCGNRYSRW